ncbi:MAG: S8 family serine peptidase [bacterium]|nr:S8 family serine peptidase [bacterium]
MKKYHHLLLVCLVVFIGTAYASSEFSPSQITIKLTSDFSVSVNRNIDGKIMEQSGSYTLDSYLRSIDVSELTPLFTFDPVSLRNPYFKSLGMDRFYLLNLSQQQQANLPRIMKELSDLKEIELVERVSLHHADYTPNDWGLSSRNMYFLDSCRVRQAWDSYSGSSSILAVTIDTGVNYLHEDLQGNIAVNTAEDINHDGRYTTADNNGIDDDNNGFIDDVIGWDFVSCGDLGSEEDYGPRDNDPWDMQGHGTHVAGSIAAVTNNGRGVPAASRNIRTLAVRAGFRYWGGGGGFSVDFIPAVQYAVNRGARVISISFGGTEYESGYQTAIDYARANNCLVFASAGNESYSILTYPAAYNGVMSVAALGTGNVKAGFSNFGDWVDISAPGVDVWSTIIGDGNNRYGQKSGTSMSSPTAASVAALALSNHPTWTDDGLEMAIALTARSINQQNPNYVNLLGSGIIDANALCRYSGGNIGITFPRGGDYVQIGSPTEITWQTVNVSGNLAIDLMRNYPNGTWYNLVAETQNDGSYNWTPAGIDDAHARIRIRTVTNIPYYSVISQEDFELFSTQIEVTTPAGGEVYQNGLPTTIQWTAHPSVSRVKIELLRSYPNLTNPITIASSVNNTGSFTWNVVTSATYTTCRIRITDVDDSRQYDVSDGNFTIAYNPPSQLTLLTPNGGERLLVGSTFPITWSTGFTGSVVVEMKSDYPNGTWQPRNSVPLASGRYDWIVPATLTNNARIRLRAYPNGVFGTHLDSSDANFSIVQPSVWVISPSGGEELLVGDGALVRWGHSEVTGNVVVELNRRYPSSDWSSLGTANVSTGYLEYTVTGPATSIARIRVRTESGDISSVSEEDFSILQPSISLSSPNGGEVWTFGANQTISWSSSHISGGVSIAINRSYPSSAWTVLSETNNTGSFNWLVTSPGSSNTRIRVVSLSNPSIGDTSAADFQITSPSISITNPNYSLNRQIGQGQMIEWISSQISGNVNIELNRDYPNGDWVALFADTPNDGYEVWVATPPLTTNARLRVRTANMVPSYSDVNDANFSITASSTLEEYFENTFPPTNWSNIGRWAQYLYNGNQSARLNYYSLPNTGSRDTLVTQLLDLAGMGSATLTFSTSYALYASSYDSLYLLAKNSNGSWTSLWRSGGVNLANRPAGTRDPTAWRRNSVIVPSSNLFAGTQFAFVGYNAYGDNLFLDSVKIGQTAPGIAVNFPNGSEQWATGSSQSIQWSSYNVTGNVAIDLNRNYPSSTWSTIFANTANDGQENWTVTAPVSSNARIRVRSLSMTPQVVDTSNNNFSIFAPYVVLSAPGYGDNWTIGTTQWISWESANITGNLILEINRNYPSGDWVVIANDVVNDRVESWVVTGPATSNARIRVRTMGMVPELSSVSSSDFQILNPVPSLQLTSPMGGEMMQIGSRRILTWNHQLITGNISIEIDRNFPSNTWVPVVYNSPCDGNEPWTVTGPITNNARFRIRTLTMNPEIVQYASMDVMLTESPSYYSYMGMPQPIVDYTVSSISITVPETLYVGDINCMIDISHSYDGDLVIRLNSPIGTSVLLCNRRGGGGDNFVTTNFDDEATTPITSGSAPFFGSFRPEQTLSYFDGINAQGVWTLSVEDMAGGDAGSISGMSLTISGTSVYPIQGTVSGALQGELIDSARVQIGNAVSWTNTSGYYSTQTIPGTFDVTTTRDGWNTYHGTLTLTTVPLDYLIAMAKPDVVVSPNPVRMFAVVPDSVTTNIQVLNNGDGNMYWNASVISTESVTAWDTVRIYNLENITHRNYNFGVEFVQGYLYLAVNNFFFRVNAATGLLVDSIPIAGADPFSFSIRDMAYDGTYLYGSWDNLLRAFDPVSGNEITAANVNCAATGLTLHRGIAYDPEENVFYVGGYEGTTIFKVNRSGTILRQFNNITNVSGLTWWSSAPDGFRLYIQRQIAIGSGTQVQKLNPQTGQVVDVNQQLPFSFGNSGGGCFVSSDCTPGFWVYGSVVQGSPDRLLLMKLAASTSRWSLTPSFGTTSSSGVTAIAVSYEALLNDPVSTQNTTLQINWGASDYITQIPMSVEVGGVPFALSHPSGSEILYTGEPNTIQWSYFDTTRVRFLRIELNRSYPSDQWESLTESTPNNGGFSWVPEGDGSTTCRVRILNRDNANQADTSSNDFSILHSMVAITSPNGGESLPLNEPDTIRWVGTYPPGQLKIQLCRYYPNGVWETIDSAQHTETRKLWFPSGNVSISCRIRILHEEYPLICDTSDTDFSIIQPSLELIYPNGEEPIWVTDTINLRWSSYGVPGAKTLRINRNYPSGPWSDLMAGLHDTITSIDWVVTTPTSQNARFAIVSVVTPEFADTSNLDVAVKLRTIAVVSPNGGEILSGGMRDTIRWTTNYATRISVGYSLVGVNPGAVTMVPGGTDLFVSEGAGSLVWNVPEQSTTTGRIYIIDQSHNVSDWSDNNFTMQSITPTAPRWLSVIRNGNAINLNWEEVDSSTTGQPIAVTGYRIYSATTAPYESGSWTLLHTVTAPAVTTWIHSDALPSTLRFYQVRAYVQFESDSYESSQIRPRAIPTKR